MTELTGRRVLLVGGASGIGAEVARSAAGEGAEVIMAGRNPDVISPPPGGRSVRIDLGDESTIAQAAADLGHVDDLVVLAADHANGAVTSLDAGRIRRALDAKVIGPLLLAKHFAPRMPDDGAIVLFSGVASSRPSPDLVVMATGNRAVEGLADALAVELAPIRVVSVSPGIVDSGAWDVLGDDGKARLFADTAAANPARRVGTPADIAAVVILTLTNPFLTATTLHVDGGARLT
ncbi:SDR family oxidoreductase [Microbacterium awajiense]|uniref:SDR family oxidoreductase n=1 Tax=Microbacterium awajiense TaxID=415214 RepID=A0ABP7ALY2_9MICO